MTPKAELTKPQHDLFDRAAQSASSRLKNPSPIPNPMHRSHTLVSKVIPSPKCHVWEEAWSFLFLPRDERRK